MDPKEFVMVVGLAVFAVQCVLRYATAKQATKVDASFDTSLRHEISRLNGDLLHASFHADEPPAEERAPASLARADMSRATVGRLIDAEQDARRAYRMLDHLYQRELALLSSLDASAAPSRSAWAFTFCLGAAAAALAVAVKSTV